MIERQSPVYLLTVIVKDFSNLDSRKTRMLGLENRVIIFTVTASKDT
jgi:hypothetical protein